MDKTKLEKSLGFLGLAAGAAAIVSGAIKGLFHVDIPTPAILIALLLLAFLQWIVARLRYSRHAPFPFPRLLWQVLFREFVSSRHAPLLKLRTAVLFAPDGEPYVQRLSAAYVPDAFRVTLKSLADSDDHDEDPEPYSKHRINIALDEPAAEHSSMLRQLLLNVQGIVIIWTKGCRSYAWVFDEVSRWSRQFPQNPCLVLRESDEELPSTLAWAATEKLPTVEGIKPDHEPTWMLLRQAVTRHSDLLSATVKLSYLIVGSWLLILALGGLSYWLRLRENYFSTISPLNGWTASPAPEAQKHYEQAVTQFQRAVNEQLSDALGVPVETMVFGTVSNNGSTCWCEAVHESRVNCFTFKSSVMSCALENDAVVGWKVDGEWKAWDLRGDQMPMPLKAPCGYLEDPVRSAAAPARRTEILCFPVGQEMTPAKTGFNTDIPVAGLCISKDKPGGATLMDGRLIRRLLWSNNLLATLPWDQYGRSHGHMDCRKVRKQ
jgi:hypothetical protein